MNGLQSLLKKRPDMFTAAERHELEFRAWAENITRQADIKETEAFFRELQGPQRKLLTAARSP